MFLNHGAGHLCVWGMSGQYSAGMWRNLGMPFDQDRNPATTSCAPLAMEELYCDCRNEAFCVRASERWRVQGLGWLAVWFP